MSNTVEQLVSYLNAQGTGEKKPALRRLVQQLYLADWKNTILHGVQLTSISWFNDRGTPNFVEAKNELKARNADSSGLSSSSKSVLDFVLNATSLQSDTSVTRLVSSTYPMMVSCDGEVLDLVASAPAYKKILMGLPDAQSLAPA